jgi:hypothetical protein
MQSSSPSPAGLESANPQSPRKSRRRTGGRPFFWNPASFEIAKADVELARTRSGERGVELARVMPHVIAWLSQQPGLGGLECPPPAGDPTTKYRIGLDVRGRPEIQRLNDKDQWIATR